MKVKINSTNLSGWNSFQCRRKILNLFSAHRGRRWWVPRSALLGWTGRELCPVLRFSTSFGRKQHHGWDERCPTQTNILEISLGEQTRCRQNGEIGDGKIDQKQETGGLLVNEGCLYFVSIAFGWILSFLVVTMTTKRFMSEWVQ